MTEALSALKSLGYKVELQGKDIKLTYLGKGEPDKDKAIPLIRELKAHKEEAIKELQQKDPFEVLFKETVDKINRQYVEGTIAYIAQYHIDLYKKTRQAEDRLNELWVKGIDFEKFKEVLQEWCLFNLKGVEIYKRMK